jgi:hypothetical protein
MSPSPPGGRLLYAVPALLAAIAAAGGASGAVCTYNGKDTLTAASRLDGEQTAVLVAPPALAPPPAPAPPPEGESDPPPPPPPAPDGKCEIESDGASATARSRPIECRVTLMGGIRLRAPWRVTRLRVDGDPFAYLLRPQGAQLKTVLKLTAPARDTMIATVMDLTVGHPSASPACPKPRDLADIMEKR